MAKVVQPRTQGPTLSRDLYDAVDGHDDLEYADFGDEPEFDSEIEEYPTLREAGYERPRAGRLDAAAFSGDVESDDWLQAQAEERLRDLH